jgi:hypothetical protein
MGIFPLKVIGQLFFDSMGEIFGHTIRLSNEE